MGASSYCKRLGLIKGIKLYNTLVHGDAQSSLTCTLGDFALSYFSSLDHLDCSKRSWKKYLNAADIQSDF